VVANFVQLQEVTEDIDLCLQETDQIVGDLNRTAKQLQYCINQLRMRPFSDLVGRFPRALRELALQYGKNVELKIQGDDTLIERSILDALNNPLMHLLRNAFDHGIEDPETRRSCGKPEQGAIEIKAAYRGNQTLITFRDDGRGIALDKVRSRAQQLGWDAEAIASASDREILTLIFEPGFSTAEQVTALSGRGVGMDVVRTNLSQIHGDIQVDTQLGVGTTFTISVPLTLSVARVLLVESKDMLLAFPTTAIEEMLLLNSEQISTIDGKAVLQWKEYTIPLIYLSDWLKFRCPQVSSDAEAVPLMGVPTVLIVAQGNGWVGIQVERCWGEQEVAIRSVEGAIPMPPGFTGCTILGDGRVVPLVNSTELLDWIATCQQSSSLEQELQTGANAVQSQRPSILMVDDSINVRRFLSLTLEKAGYRVEQAKDGLEALEKLLGGLQVNGVVCDIDMPRLDGYGFLARVKSNPAFKKLPIVMLTSRNGHKERQLALNLGATAYFSKPYNKQELLEALDRLIVNS
jgi:chemosensory pili system protein ChpA (sensor histidine kinase/response regulator)